MHDLSRSLKFAEVKLTDFSVVGSQLDLLKVWDVWILLICDWSVHQVSSLDHRNLYAHVWIWNKIYNFLLSGVSPNDIVHCCVWWKTMMSEIWLVSILIWKETEVLGVRVVREIGHIYMEKKHTLLRKDSSAWIS